MSLQRDIAVAGVTFAIFLAVPAVSPPNEELSDRLPEPVAKAAGVESAEAAPARSSCSTQGPPPYYVSPCSLWVPTTVKFVSLSPVFQKAIWRQGTNSGELFLESQSTDAEGFTHFVLRFMYAPAGFTLLAVRTGEGVGSANVYVSGNSLGTFTPNGGAFSVEVGRVGGGKCRIKATPPPFFATEDFHYKVGVKVKGKKPIFKKKGKVRKKTKKVSKGTESLNFTYRYWSLFRSLTLKKSEVKALKGKFRIIAFLQLTGLATTQRYVDRRVVPLKRKFCTKKKPVELAAPAAG